jgi:hypothetical protein
MFAFMTSPNERELVCTHCDSTLCDYHTQLQSAQPLQRVWASAGKYPNARGDCELSCTRLYLTLLLFLHQQAFSNTNVYDVFTSLTLLTMLANFFNDAPVYSTKSPAAFMRTVLRVLARPVPYEPYLVQQAR